MASLNLKTFSALVQRQAAAIQGRAAQLIDFSVGSVLRAVVESNSGLALWLQAEALRILLTTRASTSSGSDLDTFVADYGLNRLGAQSAIGTVTFSRYTPSAQAIIPVGALVKTLDGALSFQVVADTSNSAFNSGFNGYVLGAGIAALSVPVEAITPGAISNVAAGFIGLIASSIPYVDTVTNAAAITGGGDAESDASLRARFVNYITSLSRGTVGAIKFAIASLRLGLQSTIMENLNADGTDNPGFLCITVATSDIDPIPSSAVLTQAFAAADSYRAGGIWLGTFNPIVLTAVARLNLVKAPGYDENVLIGGATEAVRGYINTLPLGGNLYRSRLTQIALNSSPGIVGVDISQLNGNDSDIIASPRQIIRAGAVNIT